MTQQAYKGTLSTPMRNLLWRVAQHIYGWTHVGRHGGECQVAQALERRGLVTFEREDHRWTVEVTEAGFAEIERRWPVSPCALHTYDEQPGGWTPREGLMT